MTSAPIRARKAEDVAIIIGVDYPALHEIRDQRIDLLDPRAPRAICTLFGWCFLSPIPPTPSCMPDVDVGIFHTSLCDAFTDERVSPFIKEVLLSDDNGAKPDVLSPVEEDEERALAIIENTARQVCVPYEVDVLRKDDEPKLPYNFLAVLNRWISLEQIYSKDPFFKNACIKIMEEVFSSSHVRKWSDAETVRLPNDPKYFIAYHGVCNHSEIKDVFDAKCKCQGMSRNSPLFKGPVNLPSLPGILICFRQYRLSLVAEIKRLFYQVLKPKERSAICFRWRVLGLFSPPEISRMDVHTFDYVGGLLTSYFSAFETMHKSWLIGGIKVTRWASYSLSVRSTHLNPLFSSLDLSFDEGHVKRTMKLKWDNGNEIFLLCVKLQEPGVIAKRFVLMVVSSVFNQLFFLIAIILPAKVFPQDIWISDVDWDDPLSISFLSRFKFWLDSFNHLPAFLFNALHYVARPALFNSGMSLRVCVGLNMVYGSRTFPTRRGHASWL